MLHPKSSIAPQAHVAIRVFAAYIVIDGVPPSTSFGNNNPSGEIHGHQLVLFEVFEILKFLAHILVLICIVIQGEYTMDSLRC